MFVMVVFKDLEIIVQGFLAFHRFFGEISCCFDRTFFKCDCCFLFSLSSFLPTSVSPSLTSLSFFHSFLYSFQYAFFCIFRVLVTITLEIFFSDLAYAVFCGSSICMDISSLSLGRFFFWSLLNICLTPLS